MQSIRLWTVYRLYTADKVEAEPARATNSESDWEAVPESWSLLHIVCTVFISWRS